MKIRLENMLIIIILIVLLSCTAQANSIRFSGLSQVNKSIDVYDINAIASGSDGFNTTINTTEAFTFTPGNSYNFIIKSPNNTTLFSNAPSFMNFFFQDERRTIAILTFIILGFFGFIILFGAFIAMSSRRR
jgi:outer membrane lipoprotein-sorting protein